MIKDRFYKNISETIDKHQRFDNSDFSIVTTKGNNSETQVRITYLMEPKYSITFLVPTTTRLERDSSEEYYGFSGRVCPGPLALEESFSFKGLSGVYLRITNWLDNIWEELTSNPIVRQMQKQRQDIDEILDRFSTLEDEYFTQDEAADLKIRLDKLERELKEQIQQTSQDKKQFETSIQSLHNDIDTLKQTVDSLKKKSWLKSFTGKAFKWTNNSENRKLLKDGYNVVREFLPETYKHALPDLSHPESH